MRAGGAGVWMGAVRSSSRNGVVPCGGAGWELRRWWARGVLLGGAGVRIVFVLGMFSLLRWWLMLCPVVSATCASFVELIHAQQVPPGFLSLGPIA